MKAPDRTSEGKIRHFSIICPVCEEMVDHTSSIGGSVRKCENDHVWFSCMKCQQNLKIGMKSGGNLRSCCKDCYKKWENVKNAERCGECSTERGLHRALLHEFSDHT